ncbi:hypothetical protein D3C72_2116520 [compost metagenome]
MHLAAGTSEHDVEAALEVLLESGGRFDFEAVRELVNGTKARVPEVKRPQVDLSVYDRLLEGRVANG